MSKTILITGSTDGIGLLTAKTLVAQGYNVLLHGRSEAKLQAALAELGGQAGHYRADLSKLKDVQGFADAVIAQNDQVDVLINNAGVLKAPQPQTEEGYDIRFVVNTLAPYVLTKRLLPIIPSDGRIVNLSSAAQAPVDTAALVDGRTMSDMDAYAQSKLAITIWSQVMGHQLSQGPVCVAVNPGSLLASKMVKEGFGVSGNDLSIGADILIRAALSEEFAQARGQYYDNDSGRFAAPHAAASQAQHVADVMKEIGRLTAAYI